MNFNSDYQSNQNRIQANELVNLSLNSMKTKTKSYAWNKWRIFFEVFFVLTAIGLGYMQGLRTLAPSTTSLKPEKKIIKMAPIKRTPPENHQDFLSKLIKY